VFQKRGGEIIDMCKVQHVTPGKSGKDCWWSNVLMC